jgi:hypothetical protein
MLIFDDEKKDVEQTNKYYIRKRTMNITINDRSKLGDKVRKREEERNRRYQR